MLEETLLTTRISLYVCRPVVYGCWVECAHDDPLSFVYLMDVMMKESTKNQNTLDATKKRARLMTIKIISVTFIFQSDSHLNSSMPSPSPQITTGHASTETSASALDRLANEFPDGKSIAFLHPTCPADVKRPQPSRWVDTSRYEPNCSLRPWGFGRKLPNSKLS